MPYKVVRWGCLDEHRGYKSIYASSGSVKYIPGEPTRRVKGYGPLAAFETLRQARSFCSLRYPIFECTIKRYEGKKRALWEKDMHTNKRTSCPECMLPSGTILCKEITLTRRMR